MSTTLGILSLSALKNAIIFCMYERNIQVTLYKRNIPIYNKNLLASEASNLVVLCA